MVHHARFSILLIAPLALAASPAAGQQARTAGFSLTTALPATSSRARLIDPAMPGPALGRQDWAGPGRLHEMLAEERFAFLPELGGARKGARGFSFSVKPGKTPRAIARLRF